MCPPTSSACCTRDAAAGCATRPSRAVRPGGGGTRPSSAGCPAPLASLNPLCFTQVSAQQFGVHMMNEAKELGVSFFVGDVSSIESERGEVCAVNVDVAGEQVPDPYSSCASAA